MKPLQIPLEEGKLYHIFNRGNNGDTLFYKTENYRFFLRRLKEYVLPFIDLYAYCLLPNHFHLLVRVKEKDALHLPDAKHLSGGELASQAFHRLFTSYSKAINKQENRHGSLIENPFKRKEITDELYMANLVFYIHANAQLHGICKDFRVYPWSSYKQILDGDSAVVRCEEVLKWFDDKENFNAFHNEQMQEKINISNEIYDCN